MCSSTSVLESLIWCERKSVLTAPWCAVCGTGHFERLVKEGRWQTELHKEELELLITLLTQSYNIDCAYGITPFTPPPRTSCPSSGAIVHPTQRVAIYRLYEQQTIPRWMQNKKQEEKRKRRQSASQDGSQELIGGDAVQFIASFY